MVQSPKNQKAKKKNGKQQPFKESVEKICEESLGVTASLAEDIYTEPLVRGMITKEQQQHADKISREIEEDTQQLKTEKIEKRPSNDIAVSVVAVTDASSASQQGNKRLDAMNLEPVSHSPRKNNLIEQQSGLSEALKQSPFQTKQQQQKLPQMPPNAARHADIQHSIPPTQDQLQQHQQQQQQQHASNRLRFEASMNSPSSHLHISPARTASELKGINALNLEPASGGRVSFGQQHRTNMKTPVRTSGGLTPPPPPMDAPENNERSSNNHGRGRTPSFQTNLPQNYRGFSRHGDQSQVGVFPEKINNHQHNGNFALNASAQSFSQTGPQAHTLNLVVTPGGSLEASTNEQPPAVSFRQIIANKRVPRMDINLYEAFSAAFTRASSSADSDSSSWLDCAPAGKTLVFGKCGFAEKMLEKPDNIINNEELGIESSELAPVKPQQAALPAQQQQQLPQQQQQHQLQTFHPQQQFMGGGYPQAMLPQAGLVYMPINVDPISYQMQWQGVGGAPYGEYDPNMMAQQRGYYNNGFGNQFDPSRARTAGSGGGSVSGGGKGRGKALAPSDDAAGEGSEGRVGRRRMSIDENLDEEVRSFTASEGAAKQEAGGLRARHLGGPPPFQPSLSQIELSDSNVAVYVPSPQNQHHQQQLLQQQAQQQQQQQHRQQHGLYQQPQPHPQHSRGFPRQDQQQHFSQEGGYGYSGKGKGARPFYPNSNRGDGFVQFEPDSGSSKGKGRGPYGGNPNFHGQQFRHQQQQQQQQQQQHQQHQQQQQQIHGNASQPRSQQSGGKSS